VGQFEAAGSLGLNTFQTMVYVVLPQALLDLGLALFWPAYLSYFASIVRGEAANSMQGRRAAVENTALLASPLVATSLAQALGYQVGFTIIGGRDCNGGGAEGDVGTLFRAGTAVTFCNSIVNGVYDNPTVEPSVNATLACILGREAAGIVVVAAAEDDTGHFGRRAEQVGDGNHVLPADRVGSPVVPAIGHVEVAEEGHRPASQPVTELLPVVRIYGRDRLDLLIEPLADVGLALHHQPRVDLAQLVEEYGVIVAVLLGLYLRQSPVLIVGRSLDTGGHISVGDACPGANAYANPLACAQDRLSRACHCIGTNLDGARFVRE